MSNTRRLTAVQENVRRQRWRLLAQLLAWSERPLLALSVAWLALLIVDFTRGLTPALDLAMNGIWGVFVVDFLVKFVVAPDRRLFLRREWLTAISLALPPLRFLRFTRALTIVRGARAVRGLRLLRVLTSINRGLRALGRAMRRRGVGYVSVATAGVVFVAAAAMLAFERDLPGSPMTTYGYALWWTAMMLTTVGSDYWPRSAEGRVLCFLLALYAFAVFGYLTASLASLFIDVDRTATGGQRS